MRPQPGGQKRVDSHTSSSHHEFTGNTQHSPRNGFNRLLRALPGVPGLLATVAERNCFHRLDTSVGVSGPHDFAVRLGYLRLWHHPRPPHPNPAFVTFAKHPSVGWDKVRYRGDCYFCKSEYFFTRDWTGQITLIRFRKLVFTCKSNRVPDGPGTQHRPLPHGEEAPLRRLEPSGTVHLHPSRRRARARLLRMRSADEASGAMARALNTAAVSVRP
jgi:hypothetical protein